MPTRLAAGRCPAEAGGARRCRVQAVEYGQDGDEYDAPSKSEKGANDACTDRDQEQREQKERFHRPVHAGTANKSDVRYAIY
ncbi:unknown [Methanoculleus sp. CAG:1088]|nr:unknown [Methanoculleus sp. CAG:1088]